ncbi:hypothetical protein ACEPAH_8674 [Sanghuangporus vaninii]
MSQTQRSRNSSSSRQGSAHRDNSPKRPHTPVREAGSTSSRTEEGHSTVTVDAELEEQINEIYDVVKSLITYHESRLSFWRTRFEWLQNHAKDKKQMKEGDLSTFRRVASKAEQENSVSTAQLMLAHPNVKFEIQ